MSDKCHDLFCYITLKLSYSKIRILKNHSHQFQKFDLCLKRKITTTHWKEYCRPSTTNSGKRICRASLKIPNYTDHCNNQFINSYIKKNTCFRRIMKKSRNTAMIKNNGYEWINPHKIIWIFHKRDVENSRYIKVKTYYDEPSEQNVKSNKSIYSHWETIYWSQTYYRYKTLSN